jgi:formylglycine-generating enzyme required for sulfatase activity
MWIDYGPQGKWNDYEPTDPQGPDGFVIEWSADCNSDGIVDYGQILAGTLADTNANGVPDSCECSTNPGLPACCIGDIVADRVINGADLGTLLAYWGPRTSGSFSIASDLNNDGRVDGSDLGILLAYWGACPTANVPAWATVIETQPDPAVVTDAALRAAIVATGLPWRVRDTGTGIEMLLVPPGTFQMGCTASNLSGCNADESPMHPVTLTQAFYLGRYEVTQSQWVAKLGSNPSNFQGYPDSANRPVEQVTWNAVQAYLGVTGTRLPSEAEWEYACRAGTTTAFNNGSNDDNRAINVAWYVANSLGQTHAVGGKAPNALGFYDMAGNVWEWVNDWYGSSYYSASPSTNPSGPASGTTHVLRGGSWYYDSGKVRSSNRSTYGGTGADFGFRVARNP